MPDELASGSVVLACQGCSFTWDPGWVDAQEFADLCREGCPECGDWLWMTEAAA
jgi:hypothetical protein